MNSTCFSRRNFLRTTACGFGALAFGALAQRAGAASQLSPRPPMHAPRAKRVIFLFMQGGPSQVDLFASKPLLERDHGKPIPFTIPEGMAEDGIENSKLLKPIAGVRQHGESGMWFGDLLPHTGRLVDDICLLNGMVADNPAHPPAVLQLHTGHTQGAHPSFGSWVSYGLGTENENLPGFITIAPQFTGDGGGSHLFHSGYLPAMHQGTAVGIGQEEPLADAMAPMDSISYLDRNDLPPSEQKRQLDFIRRLNRDLSPRAPADPRIDGMIEAMDLAFRMQTAAPQLFGLGGESEATKALYGIGDKTTDQFGKRCLLARRLVEAGVRFVQVNLGGWDHHNNIRANLPKACATMDKPVAGLLTDLKARGLLNDTLVLWSGEFGRSPYDQDITGGKGAPDTYGRGHNPHGFSCWLAGGGVKGGYTHGATDDYGYRAVSGKVHLHDLHATMLHLLGLDHEKLTYRHAGRDFRLTDVYGGVVKEIIA